MYNVHHTNEYHIKYSNKPLILQAKFEQNFLDQDFINIILFLQDRGLCFPIPTILDGWDATFIMNKLDTVSNSLGRPAEVLSHFLYMRLSRKDSINVDYKKLSFF